MKTKIKFISAILCFAMLLSALGTTVAFANGNPETLRFCDSGSIAAITPDVNVITGGDANADGRISIKDVYLVKKLVAGNYQVEVDPDGADVDGDDHYSADDLRLLKRIVVGANPTHTAERPEASAAFDSSATAAKITVLRDNPSMTISFDSAIDTSELQYPVLSFMYSGAGSLPLTVEYPNGKTENITVTAGQSGGVIYNYSADPAWTGSIEDLVLRATAPAGTEFYIEYISFAEDLETANQVVATNGEYGTDTMARIIFDSAEKTALLTAANNTTVSYNSAQNAAAVTVSGGDPQTALSYSGANLSANEYKYITITYMLPTSNSSTSDGKVSELFLCAGNVAAPTADCRETFTPTKDGVYHYVVISLASASYWTGNINMIRLDPFTSCSSGDKMYVDSICLSTTRAAAEEIGYQRLASRGAAGGVYNASLSVNGSPATISYFGAASCTNDTCTFSGHTTALIGGTHNSFNRFSFEYSTNAIVRGVAYYTSGGVEYSDEFFLENTAGATKTFRSLILNYFSNGHASELKMIDLYTINTGSAAVKISSLTEEEFTVYTQGTYYLENNNYKLGVDLLMGGGVNYLEDFNDGNASYGNLLNNYDVGRLVQQSYYGIDKAPYELGWWGGHSWQYNPVQGGDKDNNISRIIDFEFRGNDEFYVKARPMDWGQSNRITPSYMENVYTITSSYVKVYNRFIDFSGYTHVDVRQELPAFYTISALKDFYFYNGSSPWTGGALTKKENLPFWGDYPNQTTFTPSNPEYWSAWCDGTGYGVGLYVPGVARLRAGRHQYNGSASPNADATNYVSPQRNMTLICGKPIEYSYLIAAGNINAIRNTFNQNKSIINNSALLSYNN